MNKEISFAEENKEKIEQLKNEIAEAFANVEQPAKANLALYDCEQCREIRKDFANVRWEETSNEILEKNYDKIPLFTPQAFNYFLSAFLIYTLKNFDSSSVVGEFTIYALTPDKKWNKDKEISSYWIEMFSLFTDRQMEVIYSFLELAKQNPAYSYELNSVGKKIFDRLKAIKAAS